MNEKLLEFIDKSWDELTVQIKEDTETHLGLPNSFVAPSVHRTDDFVFREQFYWDTYFTVLGLIGSDRKDLAIGMVDNLLFLQKKLGYIPNSNNKGHLGRSQPPLMSSMVLVAYEQTKDIKWLRNAYELVANEYKRVWINNKHPHNRATDTGLSRYYHENRTHNGAEEESGWDYTTRFQNRALDFLPIDLNCLLYLYEKNLSTIAIELGMEQEGIDWSMKAKDRKSIINELMWDRSSGLFCDYDYVNSEKSQVKSLASFLPLFCGLANVDQTRRLVANLDLFQTVNGLTTTEINDEKIDGKQWASPNGWAPMQYFVVEGLKKYGYQREAEQIASSWVNTVNDKFIHTGQIYEKYNVINPDEEPAHAVYPDQIGFAWTNAVTYLFLNSSYKS